MSTFGELFSFLCILYLWMLCICHGQNNNSILTPVLTKIRTIVSNPNGSIRDPSSVIFDPITKTWNFWATYCANSTVGHSGRIHHYYSSSLDSTWNTSGLTINISSNPSDFDSQGVFTPGVTYDNNTNEWIIYYGGTPNKTTPYIEGIGIATSKTGIFGPFIKNNSQNPVIKMSDIFWCGSNGVARVDEAKPYIIKNRKMIYTKGVCNNFTALDGIWISKDNNTWHAPYNISTSVSPIVNSMSTVNKKGFENVKIFMGPDGYLHLTGHDHGDKKCPHYVSDDNNTGFKWKFVNFMEFGEGNDYEPAVVYPNGIPGDIGGIPEYFIQFVTKQTPYYIDLLNVSWVNLQTYR
eukprot:345023_1